MKKNSLKFVFVIIGVLLFGFFGFGIYFCIRNIFGAGFMALGFGLIGMGIACILADGVLFGTIPVSGRKADLADPNDIGPVVMSVTRCDISRDNTDKRIEGNGVVSVTDRGICILNLYPTPVRFVWADLSEFTAVSNTEFVLHGMFSIGSARNEGTFRVTGAQPIQGKAFCGYVNGKLSNDVCEGKKEEKNHDEE